MTLDIVREKGGKHPEAGNAGALDEIYKELYGS
jgi:hypothetical protein